MEDEDTPLHEAVRFGASDEVEQALEQGENPNTIGFYRWSSIHEAVNIDDQGILKLLLRYGGDPNVPDNCNGSTPLHMAAKLGYVESLKTLIDDSGDINQKNRDGKTPQDVATGSCIGYLIKLEQERLHNSSNSSRYEVLEQGQGRRHNQLLSLAKPITKASSSSDISGKCQLPRQPSTLSVCSVSSTRSAESALTTRSSPIRGPNAQRTTRKPPGANTSFVNKAPGIRLSVEYSEETNLLKIRVWSVQFVTIPADVATPNTTIHVRSCVFPGTKIWSKTEDIPIQKYFPSDDAESGRKSEKATFEQPVTLQPVPLDRKMTFKSIPENELREKNVEIVLCCKTPTKIASKLHHIAKLFLKCNEAVNVVMPKWFLMTSCSIEKTSTAGVTSRASVTSRESSKSRNNTADLLVKNPVFENHRPASAGTGRQDPPNLRSPSTVSNSSSIVSVCNIKITEPIPAEPPPINKITSSIAMKNPFRKGKLLQNHAKAVTSRDKDLETRLEMGELENIHNKFGHEKVKKEGSRSHKLMNEIV